MSKLRGGIMLFVSMCLWALAAGGGCVASAAPIRYASYASQRSSGAPPRTFTEER